MPIIFRLALLLGLVAITAGCSSKYIPKLDQVLPDRTKDYKKSESLPDLEVPPDLSATAIQDTMNVPEIDERGVATFSSYQDRIKTRREAKKLQNTSVLALSDEYLLIIDGNIEQNWGKLRQFWNESGYSLELDDREYGIMETRWLQNNLTFSRDRYKVFIEEGDQPETTVFYLSHTGEEQLPSGEELIWKQRPRDEVLEKAMADKISVYFGGAINPDEYAVPVVQPVATGRTSTSATASPMVGERSEVINAGGSKYYLSLKEPFADAWRSTSVALKAVNIKITDEDKSRGTYDIVLVDVPQKKSVWSRMKFWGDDENELQISLTGVGQKTEIVVLDDDGKWAETDVANHLLDLLNSQLNNN